MEQMHDFSDPRLKGGCVFCQSATDLTRDHLPEIDDVPILTLTLFPKDRESMTDYDLRRIAEEVLSRLPEVVNSSRSFVVGGRPRQVRVLLDPAKLAAHNLCALEVSQALGAQNVNVPAGSLRFMNEEIRAEVGPFFQRPEEVETAVVAVYKGRPVYVRDVATVKEDHEIRRGAVTASGTGEVVLGLAFMLMGENSREVTRRLQVRVEEVRRSLPAGVELAPVYERTALVDRVLATVRTNLRRPP